MGIQKSIVMMSTIISMMIDLTVLPVGAGDAVTGNEENDRRSSPSGR